MTTDGSINRITALFIIFAGLSGMAAVITGAASSHAALPPEALSRIATASQYLFHHALALGICAALSQSARLSRWLLAAGLLFILGLFLFCGNLLLLGFLGFDRLAFLTPLGGIAFLSGWAALAFFGFGLYLRGRR